MDITFLAPCKDLSGGLKVIANYGNLLIDRGHKVNIVYPAAKLPLARRFKRELINLFNGYKDHLDFFNGNLIRAKDITPGVVPNSDIIVATAWETAEWIKDFNDEKGTKFYLIQGHEIWNADRKQVDATFKYPYKKIVISRWLQDLVKDLSGDENVSLIPNGADFNYPLVKVINAERKYIAGLAWSNIPNKNCKIGLKVFESIETEFPESRFIIFGSEHPDENLPDNIEFVLKPSKEQLAEIYLSTQIWLSTSNYEGFCLPCLESLCSGAIPISTDNLGVRDIIDNGINGYIVDRNDSEAMASKAIQILKNDVLAQRFRQSGVAKSADFSWTRSAEQLESLFKKSLGKN